MVEGLRKLSALSGDSGPWLRGCASPTGRAGETGLGLADAKMPRGVTGAAGVAPATPWPAFPETIDSIVAGEVGGPPSGRIVTEDPAPDSCLWGVLG